MKSEFKSNWRVKYIIAVQGYLLNTSNLLSSITNALCLMSFLDSRACLTHTQIILFICQIRSVEPKTGNVHLIMVKKKKFKHLNQEYLRAIRPIPGTCLARSPSRKRIFSLHAKENYFIPLYFILNNTRLSTYTRRYFSSTFGHFIWWAHKIGGLALIESGFQNRLTLNICHRMENGRGSRVKERFFSSSPPSPIGYPIFSHGARQS